MPYTGHVRKRTTKSGITTYQVIVEEESSFANGKRKRYYKTIQGRKKQAEKVMRDMIHELETRTFVKDNRITVREICETADINRSTFYMHYKDIYELLDEIEEQVYQEIDAIFSKESPSIHNMEQLLDYVQTHKTLLECLLQQGSGLAISRFSTILHAHYGKYLRRYAGNGFSAENEYLYEFLYTGILGVLQKWLQNECKDDRNQVADVMWRMIVQSLPHTKNPHSFSSLS